MIRHFTATGFVVHSDATLLHWHKKVREWLPPGGHVDANEDPAQAALREIKEETGFDVEIIPTSAPLKISNLEQVYAPRSIMIEDVVDSKYGEHQHIDHIYFARLVGDASAPSGELSGLHESTSSWVWVTLADLLAGKSFINPEGHNRPPPEDVLKLGEAAIRHVSGL